MCVQVVLLAGADAYCHRTATAGVYATWNIVSGVAWSTQRNWMLLPVIVPAARSLGAAGERRIGVGVGVA